MTNRIHSKVYLTKCSYECIYVSLSFTFMNISTITQTRNNEHENKIIGNPADSDKSYIIDYIKRKLSL